VQRGRSVSGEALPQMAAAARRLRGGPRSRRAARMARVLPHDVQRGRGAGQVFGQLLVLPVAVAPAPPAQHSARPAASASTRRHPYRPARPWQAGTSGGPSACPRRGPCATRRCASGTARRGRWLSSAVSGLSLFPHCPDVEPIEYQIVLRAVEYVVPLSHVPGILGMEGNARAVRRVS
jgi:hypothetical protein